MVNLSSFIRFHALRTPDRLALVYGSQRVSYAELWQRIQKMAAYLTTQGVEEGSTVAVFMKNSLAFIEISFAVSHLGAVFLPVNYRLARNEADYILTNAEASLLFYDDEFSELFYDRANAIAVDEKHQQDSSCFYTGKPASYPDIVVKKPQDLFRLMYTSGTTDRPKGVKHSYENFYWKNMDHVISLEMNKDDRLLVVGPLYHVGAYDLPGMGLLWLGGTLVIHRDFEPEQALQSIQDEQLTCSWLAPVMLNMILNLPNRAEFDVSSLKWTIGGGEKTPESRIREYGEYFTNARYIDGYGLTESCSGDTLMEPGLEITKIGSPGRALAHVEVEIRDDAGNELPRGENGEICLRGPKVTSGYWKDEKKNQSSFFADGFFKSGDMATMDDDGFIFLSDRKKDMIISGGENIASSEVERVIYLLPQVLEVAVIGIADERWGEKPVAIMALKPGERLDLKTLQAHCREHLAGFKIPKELILSEALPRNPSGKILKRVLRETYSQ